ncbi:MAG: hypothetical protein HQ512_04355 [Rhodospirillales bacterium]|nr:hypothetical protein [Rhodospirillales bacterium]
MLVVPNRSGHEAMAAEPRSENLGASAEFDEWRASIPDYEKRLYDRVKSINKRVIRQTNITIGGFVVVLVIIFVGFTRIKYASRGLGSFRGQAQEGESWKASSSIPAPEAITPNQRVKKSQKTLSKAVNNLLSYQAERAENARELSTVVERTARIIQRIEDAIPPVEDATATGRAGNSKSLFKNQKTLQRAVNDLHVLCRESAAQTDGLSALTDKAQIALKELDGLLSHDKQA